MLAPTWKPHRQNSWDRVLLPKSTGARQIVLRLRPLDAFILSESERFVLNYLDKDDDPFDSQVVHLSGQSQLSMGGYDESQVDATTDNLEYLPVRSDNPSVTSPNPHSSGPEFESDKENEISNLAENKIKFRSRLPVTLDEIRKVADNVRKAEALRSERGSENQGIPFLSSKPPTEIKTEQDTGMPLSSIDNLSHDHSAHPPSHIKMESGAASDSDSTVYNENSPTVGTPVLDDSVMGWLGPAIPQIDGSADEASIEAPGGHQASVPDEESTDDEAQSPVPFSPVDHSTLTVFEESTNELPSVEEELDVSTSTDMLEHRAPLEDATMPPPPHFPVLSKKRPSLSGEDEEKLSTHESIEVQQRSSLGASSAPPKKRQKSSLEPKTPITPSAPRSSAKSKKSSETRRSSTRSSEPSSTPEGRQEDVAASTPSKNLRTSAEREKATYPGPSPQIVFSSNISIQNKPAMIKFLKVHGVKTVEEMKDATMFCVGKGELKKTARLINAIVSGKDIVTDSWVTDSVRKHHLLDVTRYIPSDKKHEKEWGFKLTEAVQRGKDGYKPLKGYRMHFTKVLAKAGGSELKEIAILAGAEYCGAQIKKPADDLLIVATGEDGPDSKRLANKGFKLYHKDLLTLGILREGVDLEDGEFNLGLASESDEGGR